MFRDDFALKTNGFVNVSDLEQSLESDEAGQRVLNFLKALNI